MKKISVVLSIVLVFVVILSAFAVDFDPSKEITVVSREDGSGTRGAFIELTGVEEKKDDGSKVDNTTLDAIITNNTAVMMTTITGDPYAIGYISLGSLNETVKALKIESVDAKTETIKDGSYGLQRPFIIASMGEISPAAQAFMEFILSAEGQAVVAKSYVMVNDNAPAFENQQVSGKVVVAGSSSVTPVMEKLKEAYIAINPKAEIEIQQSDSSTGIKAVLDGIVDFGMSSRELKDSELSAGAEPVVIAIDGIAVIVNLNNTLEEINMDAVKAIFTGEILNWSEVK